MKSLLEVEFLLAIRLHLSPWDLNFMDYHEVKYLAGRYTQYVAEKNQDAQLRR